MNKKKVIIIREVDERVTEVLARIDGQWRRHGIPTRGEFEFVDAVEHVFDDIVEDPDLVKWSPVTTEEVVRCIS